jgi:hypothetical protein
VAWCDLEREGGTRIGPWGRAEGVQGLVFNGEGGLATF